MVHERIDFSLINLKIPHHVFLFFKNTPEGSCNISNKLSRFSVITCLTFSFLLWKTSFCYFFISSLCLLTFFEMPTKYFIRIWWDLNLYPFSSVCLTRLAIFWQFQKLKSNQSSIHSLFCLNVWFVTMFDFYIYIH